MTLQFLRKDDLVHGAVEDTAPGVRRVLCNNPSAFTFRGTNTWVIGRGRVAVLDPGPADATHLAAILDAVKGETITHILVSHTHRDHSPGSRALQAATGAPTYGWGRHVTPPEAGGEGGDQDFTPDVEVKDGGVVEGDDWRLTALHTPGHCGNHLCFAMDGPGEQASGNFFSADMVMSWSTSVVSPPDGDMTAYMNSLDRLIARGERDRMYLCGHGPRLPEPAPFLAGLKAHRLEREAKVLEALRGAGAATAVELVPPVYGPLDPRLVGPAGRSLLSHLIKLEQDGLVAAEEGGRWRAT